MRSSAKTSNVDGRASQYAAMVAYDQAQVGEDGHGEEKRYKDPREADVDSAEFNKEESTEYDVQEVEDDWKKLEEKDKYKQDELLRLREQILSVAEHQTIAGYTEVLIGEKDNPFDDEEDN